MELTQEELVAAGKMFAQTEKSARGSKALSLYLLVCAIVMGCCGVGFFKLADRVSGSYDFWNSPDFASPIARKRTSNDSGATSAPGHEAAASQPARQLTSKDLVAVYQTCGLHAAAAKQQLTTLAMIAASGAICVLVGLLTLDSAIDVRIRGKRDLLFTKILRSCLEKDGYEIPRPK